MPGQEMKAIVLIAAVTLSLCLPAIARNDTAQMCWAMGLFDNTVYFAEIENREDRSGSVAELLEISGIENFGVQCVRQDVRSHRRFKRHMLEDWRDLELEVINTTFMSDLDY
jgi:hypothetical protein